MIDCLHITYEWYTVRITVNEVYTINILGQLLGYSIYNTG